MKAKALQHLFGAGGHALVLVARLLGRGDRNQLDLTELMLADHAGGVAPRRPRLGSERQSSGGEAQRQGLLVEDALAHEIGQRNFGGGDQRKAIVLEQIYKMLEATFVAQ